MICPMDKEFNILQQSVMTRKQMHIPDISPATVAVGTHLKFAIVAPLLCEFVDEMYPLRSPKPAMYILCLRTYMCRKTLLWPSSSLVSSKWSLVGTNYRLGSYTSLEALVNIGSTKGFQCNWSRRIAPNYTAVDMQVLGMWSRTYCSDSNTFQDCTTFVSRRWTRHLKSYPRLSMA